MAAEIQSGDELVMCEMIFGGAFNELSVEQLVALCSCFVWAEKGDAGPKLSEALMGPLAALKDAARRVAKVVTECKLPLDVDEFVDSFRPDLMEAAAAWARGVKFAGESGGGNGSQSVCTCA